MRVNRPTDSAPVVATDSVWAPPFRARPSGVVTERSGTVGLTEAASSNRRSDAVVPSESAGETRVRSDPLLITAKDAPFATVIPPAAVKGAMPSVPAATTTGPSKEDEPVIDTRPGPAFTIPPLPEIAPAKLLVPERLNSSVAPAAIATLPASVPAEPPLPIWSVPASIVVPPV